nr:response regulator transcription factor [Kineosporia babensis]
MIAEDDPRQAEVLRRYLEADGYSATVVHDGRSALDQAREHEPDLLVLDVMMPGLSGLTVCRTLRQETQLPILMLTARSTMDDLVQGLDMGADDYLTKPYSPREFMARVRTLLRRSAAVAAAKTRAHNVGALAIDPDHHRVTLNGAEIDCTPGEFAILEALAQQPGRVLTRAQLLVHTRGLDRSSTERTIDVHVMNLRRKIEQDPRRPEYLLTVFGIGYRLTTDQTRADQARADQTRADQA